MEAPIGFITLYEAVDAVGRTMCGTSWQYAIPLNPEADKDRDAHERVITVIAEGCEAGEIDAGYPTVFGTVDDLDRREWRKPHWRNYFVTGTIDLELPLLDGRMHPVPDGRTARCTRQIFVRKDSLKRFMASLAPAADAEPLRQASKEEIRVEIRAVNNEAGRFGPNIVKLPKAHRDRIKALHGEVARVRLEALQTERAAKVAATEKLLNVRDATGLKLETAIRDVGKLYFELIDQNLELAKLWGFSNNARRVGALGESIIAREVSHAMFAAGRPHQGKTRFPSPGTVGLGITGDTSSGTLGERIAAASAALLEMIRAVPVAQPEDEAAA